MVTVGLRSQSSTNPKHSTIEPYLARWKSMPVGAQLGMELLPLFQPLVSHSHLLDVFHAMELPGQRTLSIMPINDDAKQLIISK